MNTPSGKTQTIAGVVVTEPVAGLFTRRDADSLPQVEPSEYVPNVSGQLFGCVFEYVNDTGRVIPYRWELVLPGAPSSTATIDGTTTVYHVTEAHRVVNHAEGLVPGESTQFSVNRIDPGDPSGKWLMELFIAGQLFKTVTFYIFAVP